MPKDIPPIPFNPDDYTMPEASQTPNENSEASIESPEAQNERIEKELAKKIEEMEAFFKQIDQLSHQGEFVGETARLEKLKEIDKEIEHMDAVKLAEHKVYKQKMSNLLQGCEQALSLLYKRQKNFAVEDFNFTTELDNKADQLSEQAERTRRFLYDLSQRGI